MSAPSVFGAPSAARRPSLTRWGTVILLSAAALVGPACGDDTNETEGLSGPIELSLMPSSITVAAAAPATATAIVSRTTSDAGAVTFSARGMPTGMTVAFDPVTVPDGSTQSVITVSIEPTVALATSRITIRAVAAGGQADEAILTISAVGPDHGSFTLIPEREGMLVVRDATDTLDVAIVRRAPFAGSLHVEAVLVPPGLTVTIDPAQTEGPATRIFASAAPTLRSGTYSFDLRGRGEGVTDYRGHIHVQVVADELVITANPAELTMSPGSSASVTITIARPAWFTGPVTLTPWYYMGPAGLTWSFDPPSPIAGATTTMSLSLDNTAQPGRYPIGLWAEGAGGISAGGGFSLVVQ